MKRRDFLKGGAALSALAASVLTGEAAAAGAGFAPRPGPWRYFEITTRIELPASRDPVRAWIPLPSIAAADWIRPLGDDWQAEGGTAVIRRTGHPGVRLLSMEWAGTTAPVGVIKSRVATRDRSVDLERHDAQRALSAAQRDLYTAGTKQIPTDGIVAETAAKIASGARSDLEKARRIYEWIVVNTFRDPKVRGCGTGDIAFMLKTGYLGGKCADLNALFVGLARAAGLPARDLYGIRIAPSRFGYRSLGANSQDITKAQHCRAEVYLSGLGWVPVDPADVRKVALEEPPGNLPMTADKVRAARKTLFGAWESNWIAYNDGHDVALPGSQGPALAFLMYPQAEVGGVRRDCLDAAAFAYSITTREYAL